MICVSSRTDDLFSSEKKEKMTKYKDLQVANVSVVCVFM